MNNVITSRGDFSRRRFLCATSVATALGAVSAAGVVFSPVASAQGRPVGTVLDYAEGVPSARSVKAAGHMGAVRYVSHRRPGANWMNGKPVGIAETKDFASNGLRTASVYQFGRAETADWLGGAASAAKHAPQAIHLHRAAGGPNGKPIYIAIDDNPTRQQYERQIRPYLQTFQTALHATGLVAGVYGNWNVIEWCVRDGIGTYYWQHDWGSQGKLHPRANIHQKAKWQTRIDGILCDINNVYTSDWGQWMPGKAVPAPARVNPAPAPAPGPATAPGFGIPENSSMPTIPSDLSPHGLSSEAQRYVSSLNRRDLQNAVAFAKQFIR